MKAAQRILADTAFRALVAAAVFGVIGDPMVLPLAWGLVAAAIVLLSVATLLKFRSSRRHTRRNQVVLEDFRGERRRIANNLASTNGGRR